VNKNLYVVVVISNPVRYQSRIRLATNFLQSVERAGAIPIVVEAAFGDRPYEITRRDHPNHVQVRTWHELWVKENLINVGASHLSQLDPDWEYVSWIDADVDFARPDWVHETIHQLQHYMVVQMFSKAHDLGPNEEVFDSYDGFAYSYHHAIKGGQQIDKEKGKYMTGWHPGYAWAWRREAWDAVGGMIDVAVLGSADQHMARSLIGRGRDSINHRMHPNYLSVVDRWETLAERHIRRDLGYVPGSLVHHWHGRKTSRGYHDRWKILRDLQFDPVHDLKRDAFGLHQLVDHGDRRSIQLRDRLREYFRSRNEDGNEL
jgi:hypothetical protein